MTNIDWELPRGVDRLPRSTRLKRLSSIGFYTIGDPGDPLFKTKKEKTEKSKNTLRVKGNSRLETPRGPRSPQPGDMREKPGGKASGDVGTSR